MKSLALVDVLQSIDVDKKFETHKRNWPWLSNISFTTHSIEISDTFGELRKSFTVNLDVTLLDGTSLTDKKNKELYELVLEYIEVFRLHHPNVKAKIHIQRIKSLLVFVCWLSHYNIRSLSKVTKTHIEKYANDTAYGSEYSLKIPERVFTSIQELLKNGKSLPFRSNNILWRSKIYETIGVSSLPVKCFTYSKAILNWYEYQLKKQEKLEFLTKISFHDLLQEIELIPAIVTIQNIGLKLIVLEEIWSWQHYFKNMSFPQNPFPEGYLKTASRLGVATKRTKTLPIKLAFAMMSESANWVLNYGDDILSLYSENVEASVAMKQMADKGIALRLRDGKGNYRDVKTLEGVLRYLASACYIVIASLTARRKEEIFDLGHNCIDGDRGDGAFWLTIYIEKTSQRYDLCPVPILVKKAIALLEKLSEPARNISASDSLWQYLSIDGEIKKLSDTAIRNSLQDFYVNIVNTDSSYEWRFSFHQFRRMFALLYYYRFDGAYIGALSYHLRHFNIEMTKLYITDEKFMKEMREIGEGWTASFLRRVVAGEAKIGGKGGDKIKRKLADWLIHFRENVDVVERERIVDKLTRYMKRVGADFTQQVWGTICTCPKKTSLRKHSNCADEKGEPDISKGSLEKCGGCQFSVYTERYVEAICDDISVLQKTKAFCEPGSVLDEITGIKIISLQELLAKASVITCLEVPCE
ncbi:hypothetical protein [Rheinheimera faecalis]